MNKKGFKMKETRIIMDEEYEIKYSTMDMQTSYDYVRKVKLFDNLKSHLPIEYTWENDYISVDKFIITDEFYYIITIHPKEYECEGCRKSFIDAITGLYNRNYLEEARKTMCNPKLKGFSLVLIDIDNLKNINDNHGHLEGDKAIEIVGESIKRSIREEDIGIRYGGDEFIIIIFDNKDKAANKIVNRIRKEMNKRNIIGNTHINISVGIAEDDDFNNLDDIIKSADKNLYKEKKMKEKYHKLEINNLGDLKKDIEKIRERLNKEVFRSEKNISNQKTLKLSRELDELLARYIKSIQVK